MRSFTGTWRFALVFFCPPSPFTHFILFYPVFVLLYLCGFTLQALFMLFYTSCLGCCLYYGRHFVLHFNCIKSAIEVKNFKAWYNLGLKTRCSTFPQWRLWSSLADGSLSCRCTFAPWIWSRSQLLGLPAWAFISASMGNQFSWKAPTGSRPTPSRTRSLLLCEWSVWKAAFLLFLQSAVWVLPHEKNIN